MSQIRYIQGDATIPQAAGMKIIAHVCNDIGAWGAGFVLAVSARWSEPEECYRAWANGKLNNPKFELGAVQFVPVEPWIIVANMIGQHGIKRGSQGPPIRYEAVDVALELVGKHALEMEASVHMPRIGCGLAGGKWERIEPLITKHLTDNGVAVTIYDFSS